ncbi:MAG TPA: hypothetical protein VMF32_14890, partial [Xanthobacteraceae bacterium]|nr:hypothetical protein [Xanthobacteraceae bacterium]
MPRLQALALAIFMLAGLAGTATAESLTPRAFTEAFAATASAAMPAAKVTVAGELHLETHSATGENITTDLHNAYQVYLADPEHLDAVIKRYVAVLVEAVGPGDAKLTLDRSHIVPVLKSTVWVQAVQRQRSSAPAVQL